MWSQKMLGHQRTVEKVDVFFGQDNLKAQVRPFFHADKMPSVFLFGEPGMGKTRFAKWIASERDEPIEVAVCPVRNLPANDGIVLLDEIHLLKQPEWLFEAMERGSPTIIGATTLPQRVDAALKSRFVIQLYVAPYSDEAMRQMISHHLPDVEIAVSELYAGASAGNPRQAMRIIETAKVLGANNPEQVLATCRITADGINEFQIRLLRTLTTSPMGIDQLSLLMYADKDSVQRAERNLIKAGLVELTNSGRKLTQQGLLYASKLQL